MLAKPLHESSRKAEIEAHLCDISGIANSFHAALKPSTSELGDS